MKIIIKDKTYIVLSEDGQKEYCKTKTDLAELMIVFDVALENIIYQEE